MTQLSLFHWRPITHPRLLWIQCSVCRYGTLNEDKHLRGWQETSGLPHRYRCADCSRKETA